MNIKGFKEYGREAAFLHRPPEKDWGSGINRNKHSYNLEYQLGNIIHSMLQEQVLMHRV